MASSLVNFWAHYKIVWLICLLLAIAVLWSSYVQIANVDTNLHKIFFIKTQRWRSTWQLLSSNIIHYIEVQSTRNTSNLDKKWSKGNFGTVITGIFPRLPKKATIRAIQEANMTMDQRYGIFVRTAQWQIILCQSCVQK